MNKILIANRGEIAVRIIRTCRDMGIASVAVFSECDRTAPHVRLADEAHAIGPDPAAESYLRIDRIIDAARKSGADAIHPGYGFLSENPEFAEACRRVHLAFIGPSPETMALMGSKTGARQAAVRAGIPTVPGTEEPLPADASDAAVEEAAETVGYPLLVKAVAGGGGKGMRAVTARADLAGAVRTARSEARSSFGDAAIYFERLLERPRHVEVQILGDTHGTVNAFAERECSIQRRHQKLVEETPSPSVSAELRATLAAAAVAVGRAAGYVGAGTAEFLVDREGRYYFLEMNARLQVEHPVTEEVTGVDFVRAQIDIARGGRAPVQAGVRGHAIECRVYAEDPDRGFLPSPGLITHYRPPSGPGIRIDSGVAAGWVVPASYDPLLSKVIAWGPDRDTAIARMTRALAEYDVRGIETTIGFCRRLLATPAFLGADFDTTSVDRLIANQREDPRESDPALDEVAAVAAALHAYRVATTPRTARFGEPASDSLWTRQARLDGVR